MWESLPSGIVRKLLTLANVVVRLPTKGTPVRLRLILCLRPARSGCQLFGGGRYRESGAEFEEDINESFLSRGVGWKLENAQIVFRGERGWIGFWPSRPAECHLVLNHVQRATRGDPGPLAAAEFRRHGGDPARHGLAGVRCAGPHRQQGHPRRVDWEKPEHVPATVRQSRRGYMGIHVQSC